MTDIDRRALMTVAGAGLLLASCSKGGAGNEAGNETGNDTCTERGAPGDAAGACYLHGDPVNWPAPRYGHVTAFNPDHLCAVYIQFTPTGIVVRQGYVASTSKDEGVFRPIAARALNDLKSARYTNLAFHDQDFENFSLGSQQIVVFFIDNAPGYVEFAPDSNDDMEQIIRFSPFSAVSHAPREANKAFYNLRRLDFTATEKGNLVHTVAYALDFWNAKANGYGIPEHDGTDAGQHVIFSMNIHLRMHIKDKTTWVPLILDPDTGNMGVYP